MKSTLILCTSFALATCAKASEPQDELPLLVGKNDAGWQTVVGDLDSQVVLNGSAVAVPKTDKPSDPINRVTLSRSTKAVPNDALTLSWKGSETSFVANGWLRLEADALDLRPFIAQGTLEFDVNVVEMAQGGLYFVIECGKGCRREVNYVQQSRALQGKGWQHLSFPLSCFVRDGDDFSSVPKPFILEGGGSGEVSVANVRFRRKGQGNSACPDYRTQSVTPVPQHTVRALGWWLKAHESKVSEVRAAAASGKPIDLVMIGDSITAGWQNIGKQTWNEFYAKHNALNLGFGSDKTENVLWRLQHGEVDGIAPKVVVLLVGTNNTGHRQEDPLTTAKGIRRVILELRERLPTSRILLLGIFPREEQPTALLRQMNDRINGLISGIADGDRVSFLNVNDSLMNADGSLSNGFMPDLIHPNELGYKLWANAMAPTLNRLLLAPPLTK